MLKIDISSEIQYLCFNENEADVEKWIVILPRKRILVSVWKF